MKLSYPRTFLLGLAFFGVQVVFSIYNAYVPIFLQSGRPDFSEGAAVAGGFGLNATVTGFVMTIDNLAAIVILPYIGALSDAVASPLGKRKPFILAGAPLAAVAFVAIPLLLGRPLALFMAAVIVMVLAMDVIRTPIIALMPDITPSPLRSQANAVINLMGGIGAVLAFLIGGALYRQSAWAPFVFGAGALLLGCLLVIVLVRVPHEQRGSQLAGDIWRQLRRAAGNREDSLLGELRGVLRDDTHSLARLLAAIFCLFLAYSALTVFFTSFATITLRVPRGQETQLLTFFALAIVLCSLPAGWLGARLGRKRTLLLGTALFGLSLAGVAWPLNLLMVQALLVTAGAGWALIVINALPMVLDSAPSGRAERVGAYTGIYYLATQSAEVIGPILVGGILDLAGRDYRAMFVYALAVLALALLLAARVRGGEARAVYIRAGGHDG